MRQKDLSIMKIFYTLCVLVILSSQSWANDLKTNALNQIDASLNELRPIIGDFPPNINSEQELDQIKVKYHSVESELTDLLKKYPADTDFLYRRGSLYVMGHNMDLPDAWEKAEKDLKSVIDLFPQHIDAVLELAFLYVNTHFKYAPAAEKLFHLAQDIHGDKILLPAHRGLIFAYYYQGKMSDALNEADIVLKEDPDDEGCKQLRSIIHEKINN
jgi:tetratricopeptide (TPR) repeat protein